MTTFLLFCSSIDLYFFFLNFILPLDFDLWRAHRTKQDLSCKEFKIKILLILNYDLEYIDKKNRDKFIKLLVFLLLEGDEAFLNSFDGIERFAVRWRDCLKLRRDLLHLGRSHILQLILLTARILLHDILLLKLYLIHNNNSILFLISSFWL